MTTAGPEEDLPTLLGRNDHLNILRYIRSHKLREPQLAIHHGKLLLDISLPNDDANKDGTTTTTSGVVKSSRGSRRLGDVERLAALEQVCIASYDMGEIELAERCLLELEARLAVAGGATCADGIPSMMGTRYKLLSALRHESLCDYEAAANMYHDMLLENPANGYAAKRKYCCVLAKASSSADDTAAKTTTTTTPTTSSSSIEGAIRELNDYINVHPGDIAAWYEMATRCLSVCDYASAAYCLEEAILGCPLDSSLHCRLAEIYCTLGGLEYGKLARKHMCQAVQLEPNNLRAWYGLLAVAECYLDEVDKLPSSTSGGSGGGGGGGGGGGSSKNKSNGNTNNGGSRKDAENDSVEVAKELVKFSAEKLMLVYKDSPKMKIVIEGMLKESSESL